MSIIEKIQELRQAGTEKVALKMAAGKSLRKESLAAYELSVSKKRKILQQSGTIEILQTINDKLLQGRGGIIYNPPYRGCDVFLVWGNGFTIEDGIFKEESVHDFSYIAIHVLLENRKIVVEKNKKDVNDDWSRLELEDKDEIEKAIAEVYLNPLHDVWTKTSGDFKW